MNLWNDTASDQVPDQYKEELCMALIEATLQVREDIYIQTLAEKGKDLALVNL